jgi:hypothetical protein
MIDPYFGLQQKGRSPPARNRYSAHATAVRAHYKTKIQDRQGRTDFTPDNRIPQAPGGAEDHAPQGIPRRALGIAPANPLFVGSRSNSASTAGSVPGFTGCRAGITKRRPSYFELRTSRYGHAKCTILSEGLAEEIRRLSLDHYRRSVIDLVLRDATVDIDTRDVGAVSKRAGRDVAAAPPSRSWTKLTNALAFAVATRPPG